MGVETLISIIFIALAIAIVLGLKSKNDTPSNRVPDKITWEKHLSDSRACEKTNSPISQFNYSEFISNGVEKIISDGITLFFKE